MSEYNPSHPYVGPEWLHSRIRSWLSKDFNKPAWAHDRNYRMRTARRLADQVFLMDCLEEANGDEWLIRKAQIYYIAVRLFGWTSKKRSKN